LKERFLEKLNQELNDVDFVIDLANEMNPEDVFSISELEKWAEENGYEKK
jgi:hypothetical protein